MEAFFDECTLAINCLWFGFCVGLCYDISAGMGVLNKNSILMWIKDIVAGALVGLLWFLMLLRSNNGNIRIVYIVITFFGAWIYTHLFSDSVRQTFGRKSRKRNSKKHKKHILQLLKKAKL